MKTVAAFLLLVCISVSVFADDQAFSGRDLLQAISKPVEMQPVMKQSRAAGTTGSKISDDFYTYLNEFSKVTVFEDKSLSKADNDPEIRAEYSELRGGMGSSLDAIFRKITTYDDAASLDFLISSTVSNGNLIAMEPLARYMIEYAENMIYDNAGDAEEFTLLKERYENIIQKAAAMRSSLSDEQIKNAYILHHTLESMFDGPSVITFDAERVVQDSVDNTNTRICREPVVQSKSAALATKVVFEKIMENFEFIDEKSMTAAEIQKFLEEKNSCLKNLYKGQYPSQLLYNACRRQKINPRVMLATLQKEQSLIYKTTASESKLDWALGVGCYDNGTHSEKYRGFEKQVEGAAVIFKNWYEDGFSKNISAKGYRMRVNYGTAWLTVKNECTYSLYMYTPHTVDTHLSGYGGGNYLFAKTYIRFFGGFQTVPPATAQNTPPPATTPPSDTVTTSPTVPQTPSTTPPPTTNTQIPTTPQPHTYNPPQPPPQNNVSGMDVFVAVLYIVTSIINIFF